MLASVEDERQSQLEYWKHHVAIEATVETMMLDSQAAAIDSLERPEILGLMPDFSHLSEGPRMIELGAGLGRFTADFAARCKHVLAVDFIEKLIEQNRSTNGHLANVDFRCADATKLVLPPTSFDFVFSNWLLMYLADVEVEALCLNALTWLAPMGFFFFRESCFRPSGDRKRVGHNPTHYRDPRWYRKTCEEQSVVEADGRRYRLRLVKSSSVMTYVKLKDNENQVYFLWQKVCESEAGSSFPLSMCPAGSEPCDDVACEEEEEVVVVAPVEAPVEVEALGSPTSGAASGAAAPPSDA